MKDSSLQGLTTVIQSQATFDLIDLFSPHVTFEKMPPQRRLYYFVDGERMCYIIRSGVIKVRRDVDEFVMASLPTPNLTGMTNMLPDDAGLFLEMQTEAEIAIITTAEAHQIIAEADAWELLAGHIAKVSANLLKNNIIMTAPTTYEVVRFQLVMLLREPESIRNSVSAAKYILERTRLSRSTVMKILAQLKQGGYIQLDDGLLTAVNHLPAKY
ncbi:helix-turn-helix domain-containing protein [Buttiauxella gaviniae]|uniref:winged helix-turn-helix transcriptional regulator n=1 Tax=Buttiauxella gaviniae TaxID=82990 RepID=UPI003BB7B0F0